MAPGDTATGGGGSHYPLDRRLIDGRLDGGGCDPVYTTIGEPLLEAPPAIRLVRAAGLKTKIVDRG
jgi:hypothetical protein